MDKLLIWVRSLGNAGAVENARRLHDQHRREDWIVRGLAHRIDGVAEEAAAAAA